MPTRERLIRRFGPPPQSGGLGSFRPLLPILLVLAFGGLAASLVVHTLALLHPTQPWGMLQFLLIPGVFPVWFAAILEARRLGYSRVPGAAHGTRIELTRALRGIRRSELFVAVGMAIAIAIPTCIGWIVDRSGASPERANAPQFTTLGAVPLLLYGLGALQLLSAWRIPPDAPPAQSTTPDRGQKEVMLPRT